MLCICGNARCLPDGDLYKERQQQKRNRFSDCRNAYNHTSDVPEGTFRTELYRLDLVVSDRCRSDYGYLSSW